MKNKKLPGNGIVCFGFMFAHKTQQNVKKYIEMENKRKTHTHRTKKKIDTFIELFLDFRYLNEKYKQNCKKCNF